MKLHLCCGDIYLLGYVNCDVVGSIIREHIPVEATTLDKYYANRTIGKPKEYFIDVQMDLLEMPWDFLTNSIDEIAIISAIEHFKYCSAVLIVNEMYRVLKIGGRLLIDFPNITKSVSRYIKNDPDFCIRHIYGSHKNQWSEHHWGYTKETFKKLLGPDWKIKFRQIVKHDYPTIGCEAIKIGRRF